MNKKKTWFAMILTCIFTLMLSATAIQAEPYTPYTFVYGSANFVDNVDIKKDYRGKEIKYTPEMDTGYGAGFGAGLKKGKWRGEIEVGYQRAEGVYTIEKRQRNYDRPGDYNVSYSMYTLMGGVDRDFSFKGTTPYVGASIGPVWVQSAKENRNSLDDLLLGMEAHVGLSLPLDGFALFAETGYFMTNENSFRHGYEIDNLDHMYVKAGLRF